MRPPPVMKVKERAAHPLTTTLRRWPNGKQIGSIIGDIDRGLFVSQSRAAKI